MNFKERLQAVLQKLNLLDKAKKEKLTHEEWQTIVNSYKEEYQVTLQEDLEAYQSNREENGDAPLMTQEEMNTVQAILNRTLNPESDGNDGPAGGERATGDSIIRLARSVDSLVGQLAGRAQEDRPLQMVTGGAVSYTGEADRSRFLFGIESPMFSMDKRWNRIAANPSAAAALGTCDEETDGAEFRRQVVAFSRSLQRRYAYLHENGMIDAKRLAEGEFATDYEGVSTAGVGNQYVTLRQDALIARVLMKRDLTQWFPVRYGIQDRDLVFNAFFSEVSQAYQAGEIWKGDMKIENEMGHVDDVMIKMKFGPMKELERMYIGYLNKEDSDPIKWNMIEFCVLNSLETAQVEQNKRRVRGVYAKPEEGKSGSYLNGSTGILYTLIRYIHENKILPHDNEAYRSYTSADMLDAVQDFVADVTASCTEDMDIDRHVIYLNRLHQPWWIKNVREAYGKDIDFTGPESYLNVVPDTKVPIRWMPYLGQLPLMFMDVPGNLQFLEYLPGEMLSVKVKEDMELVKAWSTWKEGCAAAFTGRKFDTPEKLKANAYEWQQIFVNKPCVAVEADATTLDASKGFWFQTAAGSSAAVGITDITGAKAGVAYIIEAGGESNLSTVAKSGKFANLTDAWTPTKAGDYLMVILDSEGNFREMERSVGGTRKVNDKLQPNVPGVR